MVVESVAILGITLCILVVFVRSGNADYAVAATPLLIVPAVNLVGVLAARLGGGAPVWGDQFFLIRCFLDVAGVAVACGLIVLFSGKVKNRRKKGLYVGICSAYCILLTCAYIYNTLPLPW